MKFSRRRVRAVLVKEIREYRHNGNIIYAMAILPLVFLIQPLIQVFTLDPPTTGPLHHEHALLYMLAIPALVPAASRRTPSSVNGSRARWNRFSPHR